MPTPRQTWAIALSMLPENSGKMRKWLLDRYAASTFNQCPHQLLPSMDGPPVDFHVADDAKPVKLTTPAPVPLHWQEKVKQDLDRDVNLGVLERVPYVGHRPEA